MNLISLGLLEASAPPELLTPRTELQRAAPPSSTSSLPPRIHYSVTLAIILQSKGKFNNPAFETA